MRLTDPQLSILNNATARHDGGVEIPDRLKGGPAHKILSSLIAKSLLKPVSRRGALPLWRIGSKGEELALKITAAGVRALNHCKAGSDGLETGGPPSRRVASAASSAARPARPSPKTDEVIALLSRRDGASIKAIAAQIAWQEHSVRALLCAKLKKQLGVKLTSRKSNGVRTYRIEA